MSVSSRQRYWPMSGRSGLRPFLAQPWDGGVAGWLVVFGALVIELIASIATNSAPMPVTALALGLPIVVAAGFSVLQWLQVRSSNAEPASWWHLGGIAAATFAWLVYPTSPGILYGIANARDACAALLGSPSTAPGCLARAASAMDGRTTAWWLTGGIILLAALAARRSRIAAWAAIPAAYAGCLLATHYLELLLLYYKRG
jgi:hypothetical protein